MFGKATYDIYSSAKDHWFVAFLTFGEGYHNFHHHFPGDYRNAVRWYQWDPSKWLIFILGKLGLAQDLKRVSRFRILEAKLAAENLSVQDWLKKMTDHPYVVRTSPRLNEQYQKLRHQLFQWEKAVKDYQDLLAQKIQQSKELKASCLKKALEARQIFEQSCQQWKTLQLQLS